MIKELPFHLISISEHIKIKNVKVLNTKGVSSNNKKKTILVKHFKYKFY